MRNVISYKGAVAPPPGSAPGDKYADRLLKYIPAEVVALYVGLSALLAAASGAPPFLAWVIFAVGVVGTAVYVIRSQPPPSLVHVAISIIAFIVWVFALGGPFLQLPWYMPIYGALLLPIYTFFVAFIEP
jgi:hypothetical protein